jgi:hypothetical protein
MSPRRNWDSPNPSLARPASVPLPPEPGGGARSPAGEGLGSPNSDDWKKGLVLKHILLTGQ